MNRLQEMLKTTGIKQSTVASALGVAKSIVYPTYEQTDIDLKTNLVFEHLKSQYHVGGRSVYGVAGN
jgi:predicted regulator of amino acid metabolism with ACT domain